MEWGGGGSWAPEYICSDVPVNATNVERREECMGCKVGDHTCIYAISKQISITQSPPENHYSQSVTVVCTMLIRFRAEQTSNSQE